MGTLRLDALDEPAVAAGDVARALDLGLPRALQQDARARLVEAHARAGDPARARAAAADYRARFPAGSRRAQVDTWSPPP
jgi:transmembrane sensor